MSDKYNRFFAGCRSSDSNEEYTRSKPRQANRESHRSEPVSVSPQGRNPWDFSHLEKHNEPVKQTRNEPSSEGRMSRFFNDVKHANHERDNYAEGGSVKEQAKKIAKMGRDGDTELVHVNKQEERMLKAMGGSGTVNPKSGLREYNMWRKLLEVARHPHAKDFLDRIVDTAKEAYEQKDKQPKAPQQKDSAQTPPSQGFNFAKSRKDFEIERKRQEEKERSSGNAFHQHVY